MTSIKELNLQKLLSLRLYTYHVDIIKDLKEMIGSNIKNMPSTINFQDPLKPRGKEIRMWSKRRQHYK